MKNKKPDEDKGEKEYENIELPNTTGMGIYLSAFIFIFAFGAIWHSAFCAIVGIVGSIACLLIRSFNEHTEHVLLAAEVRALEEGGSAK